MTALPSEGVVMDYSSLMGVLARVGATMDPEGWISVRGTRIGRLHDGVLSNMDGVFVGFKEIQSLEITDYLNSIAVRFPQGYFDLRGTASDVYTIQDEVPEDLPYPSNPLDIRLWMERVYPDIHEHLFFEELSRTDMVDVAIFGDPHELKGLTDKLEDTFREDFQKRLNAAGVTKGSMVSKDKFRAVLNVLTDPGTGHSKNLFYEWLKTLKWDGVPRVRNWFKWSVGASAPVLAALSEGLEDIYLGDVTEAWFVGAVRKQRTPIKHEVVPILIGQQGTGKSSIISAMAYRDEWFGETNVHVTDPAKFLESIPGAVVVELSESVQFDPEDAAFMKSFISKKSDRIRLPYASRAEDFPRHFSFISTSNNLRVLTDPTGNRRYFPMYTDADRSNYVPKRDYDPDDREAFGQEVIEQLWAEAYHLEQEGRPHTVSERAKGISEIMQEYGTVENPALITINSFLDNPMNGYSKPGAVICKKIVLDSAWGDRDVSEREKESAWKTWTDAQRDWKSSSKQVRIGSITTRSSYIRRFAPGERFRERILKADPSLAEVLDAPADEAAMPSIPAPNSVVSMDAPALPPRPDLPPEASAVYSNLISLYGLTPGQFIDPALVEPDILAQCLEWGLIKDPDGSGTSYILGGVHG